MPADWINALLGGVIIALSVSLMLLGNGRVTGISGIVSGILSPSTQDKAWRISFVVGLILGGYCLSLFYPVMFQGALDGPRWTLALAGLLVGFGTSMGSGCTSGHGVCGISRLSSRSIVATLSFIFAGILSVLVFRSMGVIL